MVAASPKRSNTKRVLRPFRRVSRLVTSRSRGTAIAPDDDDDNEQQNGASQRESSTRSQGRHSYNSTRSSTVSILQEEESQTYDSDWAAVHVERVLRQVLLLLAAYILGVSKPEWMGVARRLLEWCGIAWITCVVILVLSILKQPKQQHQQHTLEETIPLLDQDDQQQQQQRSVVQVVQEQTDVEAPLLVETTLPPSITCPQPHPSLEKFYMIDKFSNERILANSPTLHKLDNHLFSGTMIAMIRTPNVDDPSQPSGSPYNEEVSTYFSDKQRRFEYQYQVQLKKIPDGRIFFACEVDESIKLGMVQRVITGAAMAFMKKMNSAFHFSLTGGGNNSQISNGKFEKVHVGFPVEIGMDRLVVTKPGEAIPKLGGAIYEDPEVVKLRKKGIRKIDWNTEDTYTFAVWSAYVDFLEWGGMNLPGIRPFDLVGITGPQHITLTLYVIPPNLEKHYRCDMDIVAEIEMSNTEQTLLGPGAKQWAANQENRLVLETSEAAMEEEGLVLASPPSFEDDEEDTVAELGEGMYLCSGDSVILQEGGFADGNEDFAGVLSNGGGFAVLQERGSSTIVIEKVRRKSPPGSKRTKSSQLIKSGDKIMIKLVTINKNGEHSDVKYLSIHRGWWLKWVHTPPTKNGFFTIHTHETEFNDLYPSSETQSSYLTLGGTFWLRHQRWSKYEVGVSAKQSPTYGGRMLGLYMPGSSNQREEINDPDDEDDAQVMELDESEGKRQNSWMRPLLLSAQKNAPVQVEAPSLSPTVSLQMSFGDTDCPIRLEAGKFRIDVPGWIEMVNRTDRRRQLLYIVRITVDQDKGSDTDADESGEMAGAKSVSSVVRLRNGNEIAELIRLGRALKRSHSFRLRKRSSSSDALTPSRHAVETGRPTGSATKSDGEELEIPKSPSMGDLNLEGSPVETRALSPTGSVSFDDDFRGLIHETNVSDLDSDDDDSFTSDDERVDEGTEVVLDAPSSFDVTPTSTGGRKRNKLIGSIARGVKTGTSKTGKKVVKGSKKVGKGTVRGTVRTGKAIIAPISRAPVHSKKPPVKEPKSKRKTKRRREGRDHYVVVNRTLKRWSSLKTIAAPPTFLAGQLAAADQSCRTASHILSGMCDEPGTSGFSKKFMDALSAQISRKSEFDTWFLDGGAIQMGVSSTIANQKLLHGHPVARYLWESHCREEWCGVYENGVYCYAPLTNKPCLVLSFEDVQSIRRIEADGCSPLPGFPLMAIDTPSRCHYFSLPSAEARDELMQAISSALYVFANPTESDFVGGKRTDEKDIWKARFWQGFQSSKESSLSGGKGKWAPVSCSSKMRQRTILNGRRMAFDTERVEIDDNLEYLQQTSQFVVELLETALSFSFESLEQDPDAFVEFHDATSKLRTISLDRLDLSSPEAVCIFVNLYHCLLQHSLLLTVNGPLYKRSANYFMRTTCYEIGGDVFSLAELNGCVIRGNLSRAVSPKPPYIDAPRKSNAYRFYALDRVDARINFVINTGDLSCPRTVPVLTPTSLEDQLDAFSSLVVQNQLSVDVLKRLIVIPRVCAVYRNDFGNGDDTVAVMFCITFLDETAREQVVALLTNEAQVPMYMKVQPISEQYHSYLKLWTGVDHTIE